VAAAAFVLKPAFAAGILSILDALGAACHRSLLNLNCNASRGAGKTAWNLDEFTNQQLQHLDKDMVPLLENAGVVARDALDHLRETLKDRLDEIQKRQALEAGLESLGNGNTSIAAARHAREARTTEMRQMRSDLSRLPSYVLLNDMSCACSIVKGLRSTCSPCTDSLNIPIPHAQLSPRLSLTPLRSLNVCASRVRTCS